MLFRSGGKESVNTNIFIPKPLPFTMVLLSPIDIQTPYWVGYPIARYFIESRGNKCFIIKRPRDIDALSGYNRMPIKSCKGVYLKWLNSSGGFSYWLFEGYTPKQTSKSLGQYQNSFKIGDLGNALDFEIDVYSKVKKEYLKMMTDLINSPFILKIGRAHV